MIGNIDLILISHFCILCHGFQVEVMDPLVLAESQPKLKVLIAKQEVWECYLIFVVFYRSWCIYVNLLKTGSNGTFPDPTS